uniref:Alkylated DNA repair protein AlkB homologue 8 N-terminal domain-containing protein n=1 Tax=Nothobranchius pienaari TaxID=704102 RepID=A0A1A8MET6_9TELE
MQGADSEVVDTFKYLGVHLNSKLNWSNNTDALHNKGQRRLHLLRKLRSSGVNSQLLKSFNHSVVGSVIHSAVAVGLQAALTETEKTDQASSQS